MLIAARRHLHDRLRSTHVSLFSEHLLATNVTISVLFSGAGDSIEQLGEQALARKTMSDVDWNVTRTFKYATTGLPIGVVCHYWYMWLDKRFGVATHVSSSIIRKVLLSQLIFSPVCIVVFFVTFGAMNRTSWSDVCANIVDKGKKIYLAEWLVWPPASVVNFCFVPLRYRILFDNLVSLAFDVFNSYIVHDKAPHNAAHNAQRHHPTVLANDER